MIKDLAYRLEPPPDRRTELRLRPGRLADAPDLQTMAERSFATLGRRFYSVREIEGAFRAGVGVDRQLLAQGLYTVAESDSALSGCAAYSMGGHAWPFEFPPEHGRELALLDQPIAVIRSVFVDPDYAARGVGRRLMSVVEEQAIAAGAASFFLIATLTAVAFYERCGYRAMPMIAGSTSEGIVLRARPMFKPVARPC